MKSLLERAINLAKITKDNVIVADENNKEGYVIMNLAEYERLILENREKKAEKSLTDRELIDKINRDIAYSREMRENDLASVGLEGDEVSEKLEELPESEDPFSDDFSDDDDDDEFDEEENMYYYNESEDIINDNTFSFKTNFIDDEDEGNGWKIPSEIKKGAEEID